MEHIKKHMEEPSARSRREKITERGELMKYFLGRLNEARKRDKIPPLTMPRMGRLLQTIPTKDLYYLKRVCDDSANFSKKFWWEINPEKHKAENQK